MGKQGKKKKKVGGGGASGEIANGGKVDRDVDQTFLKEAHQLKEEGNKCFQAKEFTTALQFYQRGLNLIPEGHADRALFHSNRAACLMEMKPSQYDEVIQECTLALNLSPRYGRALMRRAKAYEAKGRMALALADVKLLLQNEPANQNALELERRLTSTVEPRSTSNQTQNQAVDSKEMSESDANTTVRMATGSQGAAVPSDSLRGAPSLPPRPAASSGKVGAKAANLVSASTGATRTNPGGAATADEIPLSNGHVDPKKCISGISKCDPEGNVVRAIPAAQVQARAVVVDSAKFAVKKSAEVVNGPKKAKGNGPRGMVPVKLYYGQDIRLAEMPVNAGFGELREVVRRRFPSSKAVLIKYRDNEGDLVTITSRQELRLAEAFASTPAVVATPCGQSIESGTVSASLNDQSRLPVPLEAGTLAQPDLQQSLPSGLEKTTLLRRVPPIKFYIVEVPTEQEPCVVDDDAFDEQSVQELSGGGGDDAVDIADEVNSANGVGERAGGDDESLEERVRENDEQGRKDRTDGAALDSDREKMLGDADGPPGDEIEVDDWLFDFAQLFRNQLGVDPDGHVELHEVGMELCAEALDMAATSEEAQPLFEQAAQKFQEVAALALFNWGNVYMCSARKRLPVDEDEDHVAKSLRSREAVESAERQYKLAEAKYEEALRIKPDFYEGIVALGQQAFESAKLDCSTVPEKKDLIGWDATKALELFKAAEERFKRAYEMVVNIESAENTADAKTRESKEDTNKDEKKASTSPAEGEKGEGHPHHPTMQSQINIMWGNVLFEHSQVEYRLHKNTWRGLLDKALDKFQLAGCSQDDITSALGNHPCMDSPDDAPIAVVPRGGAVVEEITSSKGASEEEKTGNEEDGSGVPKEDSRETVTMDAEDADA